MTFQASTLRYELELNRQQYDKLRKEKLAEIQNLEREYLEKVANLEKTVEAQKSEIDFKVCYFVSYNFQMSSYSKFI